ncbi:hypothetical protein BDN70DRAFT_767621, partial [Pholiota conissans]
SYRVKLPVGLVKRGLHDVFHASLLRIHVPNDDRLFPGRLDTQIFDLEDLEGEWMVEKLLNHRFDDENLSFRVQFKSGDVNWLPYEQVKHLIAFDQYMEAMG